MDPTSQQRADTAAKTLIDALGPKNVPIPDRDHNRYPPAALITDLLPPGDWAHAYFTAFLGDQGRGVISRSLAAAGTDKRTYNNRLKDDTPFAALVEQAAELWRDALEAELHDRLLHGTLRPMLQKGIIVTYVREVDNRLLTWFLERAMPEKYHLPTKNEQAKDDGPDRFKFNMGDRQLPGSPET